MSALAVVLAVAVSAQEDVEKALRASIQGFFDAVKKDDLKSASTFWSEDAPQYKSFGERVARASFMPAAEHPAEIELVRIVPDGETACVYLSFKGRWGDDRRYDDEPRTYWLVVFRKLEGRWKWWAQDPAALDLARALGVAPAKENRAALLEGNAFLATTRLVDVLRDGADELALGGRLAEALAWIDAADEVAARLKNPSLQAYCGMTRAQAYLAFQQMKEAAEILRKVRVQAARLGDRLLLAETSMFLGISLIEQGPLPEAKKELQRGLDIGEEVRDATTVIMSECFLGTVLRQEGRYAEATKRQENALKRAREVKGLAGEALQTLVMSELGQTHVERGDVAAALSPLLESLEKARKFQYLQYQGKVLLTLGTAYQCAGDPRRGLEYLISAQECWEALNSVRMRGKTHAAKASARTLLGDFTGAAEDLEAGRELLQKAGDLAGSAEAACLKGMLRLMQGDADGAIPPLREALAVFPPGGNESILLAIKSGLAAALLERRDWAGALELMGDAIGTADRRGPGSRVWILGGLGRALAGRAGPGDLEAAVDAFRRASISLEDVRRSLREQSIQQLFLSQFVQVNHFLAETLIRLNRPAEAFAVSEEAKARTLVDLLDRPGLRLSAGMSAADRREEEDLEGHGAALLRRLDTTRSTDERDAIEAELGRARIATEEFRRKIYLALPDLKVRRGRFAPATLEELNRTLFAGRPDLGVLSYLVGPEGTRIFVLRQGKDAASLAVRHVPVKLLDLAVNVPAFWAACSAAEGDYAPGARAFYELLVKPAESDLAGVTQLVVVPDRMLHFLPFQALRDAEGRHLIEKWSVSFAPSVTALLKMREIRDRREVEPWDGLSPLLAVGDPVMPPGFTELTHARREVGTLSGLFGVKALTGEEALESAVKPLLSKARRIHLATHGIVDGASPLRSFVVLGRDEKDDGFLTAAELVELRLRADLIVLSGCETGLGQWRGGEGVVGLTWSAAAAGVPASLLTQWRVEDESTGKLMAGFYGCLAAAPREGRSKASKADALRTAQLGVLKDERWRHPYYWAPFVLQGDWRD